MVVYATAWDQLSIMANLVIVAGYLVIPATALRLVPVPFFVRAAGVGFFVTCAATHLFMTLCGDHVGMGHGGLFWFMLVNHVVQAFCVWVFVLGLASAVRGAFSRRRQQGTECPTTEVRGDRNADDERRR